MTTTTRAPTTTTRTTTTTRATTTTTARSTAAPSGGDYCRESEAWIDGFAIQNGWARYSPTIEDCESICNTEGDCDAYTFGDTYCWLYSDSGVRNVYLQSRGKTSGFRRGTSDRCSGSNTGKVIVFKAILIRVNSMQMQLSYLMI